MARTRDEMAARVAAERKDGFYVNFGMGIATRVTDVMPPRVRMTLQSENGMPGIGPFPDEDEIDADLINAGKRTVTALPTSSFFSSADGLAMIRGGHIDLALLGVVQVAGNGDLATSISPGTMIKGMGDAKFLESGILLRAGP